MNRQLRLPCRVLYITVGGSLTLTEGLPSDFKLGGVAMEYLIVLAIVLIFATGFILSIKK